jgi:hypothetical protein
MADNGKRGRHVLIAVVIVLAVIVLLAVMRLAILDVFATEGDVPAASSIPLPTGSDVVDESVECGSGGCWVLLSVRPPEGMTPDELSTELGATPQARIPGTFWDPRTISLMSESKGQLLILQADYWSQE